MREERLLRLRAHHGMCLAFFEGKGYSDGFTAHMENVLAGMEQNPILQIVTTGDILCKKCPNLREDCQWGEICRRKEQERYGGYEGTAKDS